MGKFWFHYHHCCIKICFLMSCSEINCCLLQLPTHKLENYMTKSLIQPAAGTQVITESSCWHGFWFRSKRRWLERTQWFWCSSEMKTFSECKHWVVINVSHARTLSPALSPRTLQSFPRREHDFPLSGVSGIVLVLFQKRIFGQSILGFQLIGGLNSLKSSDNFCGRMCSFLRNIASQWWNPQTLESKKYKHYPERYIVLVPNNVWIEK